MSRANKNGWDFVKEGKIYQYKEDWLILMVRVGANNSDDEFYRFTLDPLAGSHDVIKSSFEVLHSKNLDGYWNGMAQFYELEKIEYMPIPVGKPWPWATSKKYQYLGLRETN